MAVKKKGSPKKQVVSKKKPATRKKAVSKQPRRRPGKKGPGVFTELKKNLLGILILLSVCMTIAMIADIYLKPGRGVKPDKPEKISKTTRPIPVKKPAVVKKKPAGDKDIQEQTVTGKIPPVPEEPDAIKYEIYKDIKPIIVDKPVPPVKEKIPRIAIIIDDIGYDRKTAMALFDLNPDITFSVLPYSPYGRKLSERLHKKGAQLMLHLPMEPVEFPEVNPGKGAILSNMSPDELLAQLKENILQIPYIVGVNNHMGSKLTANASQMRQIFTILKKDDLFFIDSRTAPKSQGKASARLLRIQFAQRDVFLDNFQDTKYIARQFEELIDIATRHGFAIGIGHPYPATLETLSKELPKIKDKIKIVRAKELTHIPG